jgi:hypothetical protein
MCPDREILSAFCDDEVPSPWKEKVEDHLVDCNSCMKIVAGYRQVRVLLQESAPEVDVEEAGRRVALRLRTAGPMAPVKKKQVSLTFAAVAATAAFIIGGGAALTLTGGSRGIRTTPYLTEHPAKPLDITVNVKDVNQLLEILNSRQAIREVTIQLPDANTFEFRSEPVFLREADYTRGAHR